MNEITTENSCHSTDWWTRFTRWITIRPKLSLGVQKQNEASHRRKEHSLTLPKENELNCQAVATSPKAVCLFFVDLVRDWSWENDFFEKFLLNKQGLLDSISLFDWASAWTRIVPSITRWVVVLVCNPIPVVARIFLTVNVTLSY